MAGPWRVLRMDTEGAWSDAMPKYRVVAVDRVTGQEGLPEVDAETPAKAAEIIAGRGYITGQVQEVTQFPDGFEPGKAMANAAFALGWFGVVFFPLAVVGWIVAAYSIELSRGTWGRDEQALCRCITFLWIALAVSVVVIAIFPVFASS